MLGELSYRQGLRLRRRLLQAVCSSSWLDAIAPADAHDYVRTARCGLYPPGGETTGSDETSPAVRDERLAAAEYAHWLLGLPTQGLTYHDPIPKSSLSLLPTDVATELTRLSTEFAGQTARSVRAATTAFRRACRPLDDASIRGRRGLIELRYAGRCYGLLRYASELPTRNVSVGSGRSAGCVLTMLPESEAALRREIAFAEANEDVVPSARRFTRSNPFRAAPEDRLGLRALLGSRRTARPNDGNLRPRPSAPIATR